MKKDNDKKRKINLSFDNLAIPEVHLHRTHKDNANADTNNENTVEKSVDSQSVEGNESTDSKKEKFRYFRGITSEWIRKIQRTPVI